MRFRPDQIERFRLTTLVVDPDSGVVELGYALDDTWSFTERLAFGPRKVEAVAGWDDGFARVARLLHLAAGVSYYKAAMPGTLVVETGPISDVERRFCIDLYDKGLRELAWHNGLPLERRITVDAPTAGRPGARPAAMAPPAGIGIPIGGGKDSAVVVEALRDRSPTLVSVNGHPAALRVAAAAGLEVAVVGRALDPLLLELNDVGARNGHVPITAIVSLVAVAAGFRLGYDTTVMALEKSADEPTRVAGGGGSLPAVAVNHQWSKSSEFEEVLAAVLADTLGPGVRYRSALRQAGELDIAAAFALMPRYHRAFLSCNRAFARSGADRWCGECPKCRFVYLALATSMGPDQLVPIFGRDLLREPDQVAGFRDLFEEGRKPFECVGTRDESLTAFAELGRDPAWADAPVVRALAPHQKAVPAMEPAAVPGAGQADGAGAGLAAVPGAEQAAVPGAGQAAMAAADPGVSRTSGGGRVPGRDPARLVHDIRAAVDEVRAR